MIRRTVRHARSCSFLSPVENFLPVFIAEMRAEIEVDRPKLLGFPGGHIRQFGSASDFDGQGDGLDFVFQVQFDVANHDFFSGSQAMISHVAANPISQRYAGVFFRLEKTLQQKPAK
jgi:hypothetical protein